MPGAGNGPSGAQPFEACSRPGPVFTSTALDDPARPYLAFPASMWGAPTPADSEMVGGPPWPPVEAAKASRYNRPPESPAQSDLGDAT